MKYTDLKIGQKVFFVSAQYPMPAEDVLIIGINENNTFSIERNGKTVFCEITNEVGAFNFGASDEEKERLKESTEFIKNSGLEKFKMETEQIALTNKEKQKADDDARMKREQSAAAAKKRREAKE